MRPQLKNTIQTLQSWPRDRTVASVKPSARLPGWHRCCLYNVNVGVDVVTLLAIWNTAVIFEKSQERCLFFKLCPDLHAICTHFPFRRQAINRINDGLMSFEAWSTRFMALNSNTLIFSKENAFENVVCTIWAFWYRYQCARTIASRIPGLMCHQLFYNNPSLV